MEMIILDLLSGGHCCWVTESDFEDEGINIRNQKPCCGNVSTVPGGRNRCQHWRGSQLDLRRRFIWHSIDLSNNNNNWISSPLPSFLPSLSLPPILPVFHASLSLSIPLSLSLSLIFDTGCMQSKLASNSARSQG